MPDAMYPTACSKAELSIVFTPARKNSLATSIGCWRGKEDSSGASVVKRFATVNRFFSCSTCVKPSKSALPICNLSVCNSCSLINENAASWILSWTQMYDSSASSPPGSIRPSCSQRASKCKALESRHGGGGGGGGAGGAGGGGAGPRRAD